MVINTLKKQTTVEAKELRIGNYIDLFGVPVKVHPLNILGLSQIEAAGKLAGGIKPIPLTPEILEKIGGKNRGGWIGYFYDAEVYGEDVRIVWQLMDGGLSIFANDNLIKYEDSPTVHSFQNSVYYLTGEELEIRLL